MWGTRLRAMQYREWRIFLAEIDVGLSCSSMSSPVTISTKHVKYQLAISFGVKHGHQVTNKLLRILLQKPNRTHTVLLYRTYHTLPVQLLHDLHDYQILVFMHK